MVIIRAMGGLGNQLQQYALYKKLEALGIEAKLDVSWFRDATFQASIPATRDLELDYFVGLEYQEATEKEIRQVLGRMWEEPESIIHKVKRKVLPTMNPVFEEKDIYHSQIFSFTNKYLVGYWACERYYADIMDVLQKSIRFPMNPNASLQKKNEDVICQMEKTDSVSIHIRRGDYLDDINRALFGGICTESYYETAVRYIKEKYPQARFFIFSDDTDYVRQKYQGEEYQVIDWNHGKDSFFDMMLMSHCKHNICANSTFSFWGARLNIHKEKIMIRPSIHKNTQVCIPEQMKELWNGWEIITPQGEVL